MVHTKAKPELQGSMQDAADPQLPTALRKISCCKTLALSSIRRINKELIKGPVKSASYLNTESAVNQSIQ